MKADRPVASGASPVSGDKRPGLDEIRAIQSELQAFYEDYAACLDDGEIEKWPDFFTEGARYQVIARENYDAGLTHATIHCEGRNMIQDRALAIRETAVYEPRFLRHLIGGVRVACIEDDGVRTRTNFAIFESMSDREPCVLMVGRYIDVVVRERGRYLFSDRRCVFDNYRIRTSLIVPA